MDAITLTELKHVGTKLAGARTRLDTATQAAITAANRAKASGTPETRIADTLGVSRETVRRWISRH